MCLYGQRRFEEAEPYYREAMQSYRRILGNEEPRTLVAISNMGYLLQARGRRDEAIPLWREALETRRRTLGNEHPDTLLSLITYGNALYAENRKAEAEVCMEEALATARQVLAPGHPLLLSALDSLGLVYRDRGKLPDAERLLREELDAQRHMHKSDHPAVANALANLGTVELASGGATHAAEAETVLRECVDMRTRLFPEGNPQVWQRWTARGGEARRTSVRSARPGGAGCGTRGAGGVLAEDGLGARRSAGQGIACLEPVRWTPEPLRRTLLAIQVTG
jgi:hypothetical protein